MNSDAVADGLGALISAGFVLGILLVIFLVLREFWCWYWKINELSKKADKIIEALGKLDKNDQMHQAQMIALMRTQREVNAQETTPSTPSGVNQ